MLDKAAFILAGIVISVIVAAILSLGINVQLWWWGY